MRMREKGEVSISICQIMHKSLKKGWSKKILKEKKEISRIMKIKLMLRCQMTMKKMAGETVFCWLLLIS